MVDFISRAALDGLGACVLAGCGCDAGREPGVQHVCSCGVGEVGAACAGPSGELHGGGECVWAAKVRGAWTEFGATGGWRAGWRCVLADDGEANDAPVGSGVRILTMRDLIA
jgi:hypothetical protein